VRGANTSLKKVVEGGLSFCGKQNNPVRFAQNDAIHTQALHTHAKSGELRH
jgi:hypothetical protein